MKVFNKNNLRFFISFLIVGTFFFMSYSIQEIDNGKSNKSISKDCCIVTKESTLNNQKPGVFIQSIDSFKIGNFYRFILKAQVIRDTTISVYLANSVTGETILIGTMGINDGANYLTEELIFKVENKFDGIVLQKQNPSDDAEIFIQDFKVSLLNIKMEKEIAKLKPSILGSTLAGQKFLEKNLSNKYINQINKNGILFGQVFIAESDIVSAIVFDPEILDLDDIGDTDYTVELRKAYKEGEILHLHSEIIESVVLSRKKIKDYYSDEGNVVRIPLSNYIFEGEYYFIGVKRSNANYIERDYLDFNQDFDNRYFDQRTYEFVDGHINEIIDNPYYFKLLGLFPTDYTEQLTPSGVILEDLGGGIGKYTYKSLGGQEELFDIIRSDEDVEFDSDRKLVFGRSSKEGKSYFEYKFDTIYPVDVIKINARQADPGWRKTSVFISFDQKNWNPISWKDEDSIQVFSQEIKTKQRLSTFYIKILPENSGNGKYGIKDLFIEAKLYIL